MQLRCAARSLKKRNLASGNHGHAAFGVYNEAMNKTVRDMNHAVEGAVNRTVERVTRLY